MSTALRRRSHHDVEQSRSNSVRRHPRRRSRSSRRPPWSSTSASTGRQHLRIHRRRVATRSAPTTAASSPGSTSKPADRSRRARSCSTCRAPACSTTWRHGLASSETLPTSTAYTGTTTARSSLTATRPGVVSRIAVRAGSFAQAGAVAPHRPQRHPLRQSELHARPQDYARIGKGAAGRVVLPEPARRRERSGTIEVETVSGQANAEVEVSSTPSRLRADRRPGLAGNAGHGAHAPAGRRTALRRRPTRSATLLRRSACDASDSGPGGVAEPLGAVVGCRGRGVGRRQRPRRRSRGGARHHAVVRLGAGLRAPRAFVRRPARIPVDAVPTRSVPSHRGCGSRTAWCRPPTAGSPAWSSAPHRSPCSRCRSPSGSPAPGSPSVLPVCTPARRRSRAAPADSCRGCRGGRSIVSAYDDASVTIDERDGSGETLGSRRRSRRAPRSSSFTAKRDVTLTSVGRFTRSGDALDGEGRRPEYALVTKGDVVGATRRFGLR